MNQSALIRFFTQQCPGLCRSDSHPLQDSIDRILRKAKDFEEKHGRPLPMLERRLEDTDQIAAAFGDPVKLVSPDLTVVVGCRRLAVYGASNLVEALHARISAEFDYKISSMTAWDAHE